MASTLQAHQIQAALDPSWPASLLGKEERLPEAIAARLDRLVSACAQTGCPPCMHRMSAQAAAIVRCGAFPVRNGCG